MRASKAGSHGSATIRSGQRGSFGTPRIGHVYDSQCYRRREGSRLLQLGERLLLRTPDPEEADGLQGLTVRAGRSAITVPPRLRGGFRLPALAGLDLAALNELLADWDLELAPLHWEDLGAHNLVPDEGLDYILDTIYKNGTRADPLYIGLSLTATPAAGWTMANSATTWNRAEQYSGLLKEFVDGARAAQSIDNSASVASFAITGSETVQGFFLKTTSAKDALGSLLGASNFTEGAKAVDNGDTLQVTCTVTQAAA